MRLNTEADNGLRNCSWARKRRYLWLDQPESLTTSWRRISPP